MRVLITLALMTAIAISAQTLHIQAQLTTAVKLKKAKAGDKLKAHTVASVTLANGTTIPTGSTMLGQVLQVDAGSVTISFDTANVDGKKIPLNVTLVAVAMIGGSAGNGNAKMESPSPDDHPLNGGPRPAVEAGAKTLNSVGHESLSEVNAGGKDTDNTHARMVAAHSGSVIGLPGVAMVVDDGPPFASRFTITAKDMQLPDGIQLMFSVR
jgi:hypothetical protein